MPRHSKHRACDDFQETARALTRRQLLGRSLGAGLSVYMASGMPFTRVLEAAEAAAADAPRAPVLVTVFLAGGCDLLSTLAPVQQAGSVADLRGKLALQQPALAKDARVAAHPALSTGQNGGIAGLFEAGKVGFLPGIDYHNPDLSHFHSRHFWETGLITQRDAPGWLGRWLDRHGRPDNPLQALTVGGGLSPVLRSVKAPAASVGSPGDAQLSMTGVWGDQAKAALRTWERLAKHAVSGQPGPQAAAEAARLTKAVADRLAPYQGKDGKPHPAFLPKADYPKDSDLADKLQSLAGMLSLPLGIRLATVDSSNDFDTHDNQAAELRKSLGDVSGALSAFQADLEARGLADRVMTLVWSEFGRRPQANDSGGTDHGAGGIAWVQGTRAASGVLSEYPDVRRLDREGNLRVTVDFRRVYASLIEQWLGTDASEVIPNAKAFGRIALVR
ncbi:MAG TPA: DUF1501 domain-containing protein [Solirubrobacteraceae bacterium]|jgi:uncharacterized protein (DUF1501 family)|nr:DUF1501 domain-containing protein [Solirubrobacteraceae bacterium]